MSTNKLPRGLRNNNPLNIRRTKTVWKGMRKEQTDAQFCQFEDIMYGWRAAFWLLTRTYYYQHHCTTPQAIIMRWAPPQDHNDTNAYINRVCAMTGLKPADPIPIPGMRCTEWLKLGAAMAIVENGTAALDYFALLDGWQLCRDDAAKGGL